jgi:hypothetical protein
MKILNECDFLNHEGIRKVEEQYNARYVFESCIKDRLGNWTMMTAAIFYTEIAHPKGSNYFALYHDDGGFMITDGISATQDIINAVRAHNGDIIYSRHRHDYRISPDKTVWIDGGRDYLRSGLFEKTNHVNLKVVDDHLEVIEL